MLNRIFATFAAMLAMQLTASAALAQSQQAVTLSGDVMVMRTVEENGAQKTVLEPPSQVIPGDRLVFTTRYTNTSAETVADFVVTNPLPAPVMLAEDGSFEVSVDGGKSFGKLAALSVTLEDGADRPAELADVTHIRWTLARLTPGEQGSLSYFAVIR